MPTGSKGYSFARASQVRRSRYRLTCALKNRKSRRHNPASNQHRDICLNHVKVHELAAPAARLMQWLGLVAVIIGARLWLISGYGIALPIHDQWDAEAAFVFKPWLENTLRWSDVFAPHNEHRMVLSRLLALGLLQANGQWDALLEMTVNALLAGLFGLGIAAGLVKILGSEYRIPVLVAVMLWLVVPFGHENTLWGFHAFHFLLFFSFLAMWGLGFFPAYSRNWWLGVIAAALACFSTASGFFAAGVVLILEAIRLFSKQRRFLESAPTCFVAIAVVALGLSLRISFPPHDALKAASAGVWLSVFARSLAWPYCALPIFIVVMYLPWAIYTFLMLTTKGTSRSRTEIIFGIGVWVIAQAAAIAYARGENGNIPIASRYMDVLGLGAVINALGVVALLKSVSWTGKWRIAARVFGAIWIAGLVGGAAELGFQKLSSGPGKEALLPMEENVRGYVATHDPKYLTGDLPYPDAKRLANLLDDPTIRKILPAIVRPVLPLEIRHETGDAFSANGYPAGTANPPYEKIWGSYSQSGSEARGSIESESFRPELPYLQFALAGNPRGATALALRDVRTGKEARVRPHIGIDENWWAGVVRVPSDHLQLIARDEGTEDWIAFREPRELGRLSYYTQQIMSNRQNLFRVGVALLALAITGGLLVRFQNEGFENQRN